jgi:hypothetical protein
VLLPELDQTSLLEEMSHSAEGFFPPAALTVCVFRDASSPASSAATVDLDHALNGTPILPLNRSRQMQL